MNLHPYIGLHGSVDRGWQKGDAIVTETPGTVVAVGPAIPNRYTEVQTCAILLLDAPYHLSTTISVRLTDFIPDDIAEARRRLEGAK